MSTYVDPEVKRQIIREWCAANGRKSGKVTGPVNGPANLRKAHRQRRCCAVCGLVSNPGSFAVHQKATGHRGWSEASV